MMNNKDNRKFRRPGGPREEREFDQKILDLARVTRVTKGGKHMRFRACIILGDKKGRVGYGVAKGADVAIAVNKAATKAKKTIVKIPLVNETIAHEIWEKFGAARVMIKPAPKGTGIKAGGAMRVIFELAGVPNVIGKILGSNNKINNTKATISALKKLTVWNK
jgi:small subunit ribosomal protein S5